MEYYRFSAVHSLLFTFEDDNFIKMKIYSSDHEETPVKLLSFNNPCVHYNFQERCKRRVF